MPFILIKGTFHLVNRAPGGKEVGFEPDGDSIHFKPANPSLLDRLTKIQRPYRLSTISSVQLRFEGIDALELHYRPEKGGRNSHQPRPLADEARDYLTGKLGLNPVPYQLPHNIRVKPPVAKDATLGFILSRTLEVTGRPVSFVFTDNPPGEDGEEVYLRVPLLKRSINYKLVQSGNAYPLFYEGLFVDLRDALLVATRQARAKGRGLWSRDRSKTGLRVIQQSDLESKGVIFPKLFRRLTDYLAEGNTGLADFKEWLAEKQEEQVLDLRTNNFTHFDEFVHVQNNKVRLTRLPEELVFISKK